ncbi:MAG: hypothetical protein WCB93_06060, partial [Gallionella sp.]
MNNQTRPMIRGSPGFVPKRRIHAQAELQETDAWLIENARVEIKANLTRRYLIMTSPARIVFLLPLFLVACGGTFPLFGAVEAPHGTSANQQKNDIAFCRNQAVDQASNNGEQAEAFLFGSSARKKEQTLERNVFS